MSAEQHIVLIIGGRSGIGNACVDLLSDNGFLIIATKRDMAVDFSADKTSSKAKCRWYKLDITSEDSINSLAEDVASYLGEQKHIKRFDLINCAGNFHPGPIELMSRSELSEQLAVNVQGAHSLVRAFFPLLRRYGGRVISIGSTSALFPSLMNAGYAASKAAMLSLDKSMRLELARFGVHVISILPGVVSTPFWAKAARIEAVQAKSPRYSEYASLLQRRQHQLAELQTAGELTPASVAVSILKVLRGRRPPKEIVLGRRAKLTCLLERLLPKSIWARRAKSILPIYPK